MPGIDIEMPGIDIDLAMPGIDIDPEPGIYD